MQISDIHISIFHDFDRINDLKEFCDVTLDAVKPEVVLASGNSSHIMMAQNNCSFCSNGITLG